MRAVPAMKAPLDLFPKTATVMLGVPSGRIGRAGA